MADLELRLCKNYKEKCGYMLCHRGSVGYTAWHRAFSGLA